MIYIFFNLGVQSWARLCVDIKVLSVVVRGLNNLTNKVLKISETHMLLDLDLYTLRSEFSRVIMTFLILYSHQSSRELAVLCRNNSGCYFLFCASRVVLRTLGTKYIVVGSKKKIHTTRAP